MSFEFFFLAGSIFFFFKGIFLFRATVTDDHRQKEVEKNGDRQMEDVAKNMAINHQMKKYK